MRAIAELLNKHVGEEAWIFGKGPSLDGFDFESAGNVRICINESLLIVPQAKYFFAHDEVPIQRVSAHWPSCCGAILEPKRCDWAKRCGIPDDLIYNYVKRERELEVLNWSAEQIAAKGCLLGLSGTAHSAIHFCRLLGVSGIALVGMDGEAATRNVSGSNHPWEADNTT